MNWEAVGAIAESIGALGVIATLIYLATQIRQNTSVVQTATYTQLNSQISDFVLRVAEDSELHDLWLRGQQSHRELSAVELDRYYSLLSSMFTHFETAQRLRHRGQIDAELYEEVFVNAAHMLTMPGPKQWWLESKSWFSPVFAAALDDRVDSLAAQQSAAADSA